MKNFGPNPRLLKLTWTKGPLFLEEGGLFFRVSAVFDIPSLPYILYFMTQLVKDRSRVGSSIPKYSLVVLL